MAAIPEIADEGPWLYFDDTNMPTNPTVCRCLFNTGQQVTAEWVYRAYAKRFIMVSAELREKYPEIQKEWAALEGHELKMVAWRPLSDMHWAIGLP